MDIQKILALAKTGYVSRRGTPIPIESAADDLLIRIRCSLKNLEPRGCTRTDIQKLRLILDAHIKQRGLVSEVASRCWCGEAGSRIVDNERYCADHYQIALKKFQTKRALSAQPIRAVGAAQGHLTRRDRACCEARHRHELF